MEVLESRAGGVASYIRQGLSFGGSTMAQDTATSSGHNSAFQPVRRMGKAQALSVMSTWILYPIGQNLSHEHT